MAYNVFKRHPLLRHTDQIVVQGYNGDVAIISGVGMGSWGPELAAGSTGLFEAPMKTYWGKGLLGERFEYSAPKRRDVVFTMHIMNPDTGEPALDNDPALWHNIYSRWRAMWSGDFESTIIYRSLDGDRELKCRLLKEPEPFVSQNFEGKDPHLIRYGSVVMAVACENPYYQGPTAKYAHEISGQGDFWFRIPFFNPGSVPIWPEWFLTDRAQWILPDYSWESEEFGRGQLDEGKLVPVPAVDTLLEGENVHIMTRPDKETIRAENDAPVGNRMNGRDFEYPIQPGCGEAPEQDSDGNYVTGATVRAVNVTNPDGCRCEVWLPRWYAEPFSAPRVA